jgi:hypothetical protein
MPFGTVIAVPQVFVKCSHPLCNNARNNGFLHCSRDCSKDHERFDKTGQTKLFVMMAGNWIRVQQNQPVQQIYAVPSAHIRIAGHIPIRAAAQIQVAAPVSVAVPHRGAAHAQVAGNHCLRPGCGNLARQGSRFCSSDCREITGICANPGCTNPAATSSNYCLRHTRASDLDPRIALVGGVYHQPRNNMVYDPAVARLLL